MFDNIIEQFSSTNVFHHHENVGGSRNDLKIQKYKAISKISRLETIRRKAFKDNPLTQQSTDTMYG
jgi:hypothetical protein